MTNMILKKFTPKMVKAFEKLASVAKPGDSLVEGRETEEDKAFLVLELSDNLYDSFESRESVDDSSPSEIFEAGIEWGAREQRNCCKIWTLSDGSLNFYFAGSEDSIIERFEKFLGKKG